MITLILGALLAVADAATHWTGFRWAGLALGVVAQFLAFMAWLRARRAPVAILYTCPYRCGFQGGQAATQIHAESCRAQRWAA